MILVRRVCGQGTLEFVLIFGFFILIIIGSILIIQKQTAESQKQKTYAQLEEFGNVIRTEIQSAQSSQGEYSREFFIPETINGKDYQISLYNNSEIIIKIEDIDYVVFLDNNVKGNIDKGKHLIKKEGGTEDYNIIINPLN